MTDDQNTQTSFVNWINSREFKYSDVTATIDHENDDHCDAWLVNTVFWETMKARSDDWNHFDHENT